MTHESLARLPRVDRVLAHPALEDARRRLGAEAVTALVRDAIAEARDAVRAGAEAPSADDVARGAASRARARLAARARGVINATGVVLHTNLGRAPLGRAAVEALAATAGGYASVEIDLASGKRGGRGAFAERALAELAGAEAALVVNNCAAAVLLLLSVVAARRAVVVSRGELIEIGGGFRVPEVMERSGARLVEVGTTNKTRLADYARAMDANVDIAAILRVHPGNFRQSGFVERPELAELAALAHARGVPLLKDLGGGALVGARELGASGEPRVRDVVSAGADAVCFSTDKVLGGPQGGVILGRAEIVERCRRDPLARALRMGRLPLVALEATLAAYLEGNLGAIPTLAMATTPREALERRAIEWRARLAERDVEATVIELNGEMGGGSLADVALPSAGLAIACDDPDLVAARLRSGDPAVIARIQEGSLWLDARTVLPGEDDALLEALTRALG